MNMDRVIVQDKTATVQTTHGVVTLDAKDAHLLECGGLEIKVDGYAYLRNYTTRKRIGQLARLVMQPLAGFEVDHINHNPLDNRRSNLRIATRSENMRNNRGHATRTGSRFKGVTYHDATRYGMPGQVKRWRAYTRIAGKRIWLGYYATEQEAADAYDAYAVKTFGAFAMTNRAMRVAVMGPVPGGGGGVK